MADRKEQEKIPIGKIERAGKFLRTGLRVGVNYAEHYAKKALLQNPTQEDLDRANAEDIFEGVTELRGSALKVAQMLSMDTVNLSKGFTAVLAQAQYSVPPMSAPLAINTFKKSLGKSPEDVFDKFNPLAAKAASMGQVHEAWKDGKKYAVKIQYPGVGDSIRSDLKIVKQFAPQFVDASAAELEPYFQEVEGKLLEEADYGLELRNSMEFRNLCKDVPGVVFPEYFPELSADRVLTMSWLDGGLHLRDWLATHPPKNIVNKTAQTIWDFYEYQVHVLRRINADPHPGNFLFFADGTVGVLDFGCTKVLTQQLYDDYFTLADPKLYQDPAAVRAALVKLEILRPTDTPQKEAFITDIFVRLIGLLTKPMHTGTFYFNDPAYFKAVADIGLQISKTKEVRGNKEFLFVNRTFFGIFTMMQALDADIRTASRYLKF
jgi:predicted unusual protein kinase regulating ubiquinone biosynthesis (AarF/ABC1/UbiB family)